MIMFNNTGTGTSNITCSVARFDCLLTEAEAEQTANI